MNSLVKRRNVIIGVCAVLFIIVALSSAPSLNENFRNIIPQHPPATESNAGSTSGSGHGQVKGGSGSGDGGDAHDSVSSSSPPAGGDKPKTSQFHFLIPASKTNIQLCYNVVSSITNRYPVPMLLGWHGTGLLDAHKTHLAKLRAIRRYLWNLPKAEDDDLVAIVDGYDIIMQMPPQVMIERYFEMADQADARLAKTLGVSVDEARAQGIRNTVFWGPDKICWPGDHRAARCWAVPTSSLGPKAFGPKSGNGEMYYSDPRWLNSGTVIGPISDVRKLVDATMDEIDNTYDAGFAQSESDQFYIANVWGLQEYNRLKVAANGGEVKAGPGDKFLPQTRYPNQEVEYHIAIDYESNLFQTKAGYEPFFGYLQFDKADYTASQTRDMFEEGDAYKPYDIKMPANVVSSMGKLYDDIAEAHPGKTSSDWLRTVKLGTNFVSRHIYGLWHCTGPKEWIDKEYPKLWFYPYVRPLIKAAIKSSQDRDLILPNLVGGRYWAPKTYFPDAEVLKDQPWGGAWSDFNGTTFVNWKDLCGEFEETLFGGDVEAFKAGGGKVEKPKQDAKKEDETLSLATDGAQ